ncbi:tetratricopeptide repeat protein [Pedobacter nutrimenti]|uniref:tetratricopeptide repeat protein n=1 Tax=Pedobacter nutrimenti TaxID=1241337 RepID=UPI002931F62F|nr:tetratricopeptide repeat protein [Pedobacter nutrimenti]
MIFLSIIISLALGMYLTAPVITVFHELGHALTMVALTKTDQVDVYIGSYGNQNTPARFKIGKLQFYVNINPTFNIRGMCRPSQIEGNYVKQSIILLAGPIISFLFAVVIGAVIFNTELHGAIKLYAFVLLLCSFMSCFQNIVPRTLSSGLYNDGRQLRFVYKLKSSYAEYVAALEQFGEGHFEQAAGQFIRLNEKFPYQEMIIRPLSVSLLQLKRFEEARVCVEFLEKYAVFTVVDCINRGCIESIEGKREEALKYFERAVSIDKRQPIALNNLGYELILKENYDKAGSLLKRAIEIAPDLAEPHDNLGHLKILKGELEEGKMLLEQAIKLKPNLAGAYLHLGIYYKKVDHIELAEQHFNKAMELDPGVIIPD